jgi:hypothetical protein
MIVIPIESKTHGLKHYFIDGDDFDKIKTYNWHITSTGYIQTNIKNNKSKSGFSSVGIHRIILDCPDAMLVDHINHNPLDNRKENLRICTNTENCRNSKKPKNGKLSKYKGVSMTYGKYWFAQIGINGKRKRLGTFENEIDAAKAYNEAALKYHGEFALLNEIPL